MTVYKSQRDYIKNQMSSYKSPQEKAIKTAGGFPNCKGLYPDCPEKPDKEHPMCRSCPVLDEEDD